MSQLIVVGGMSGSGKSTMIERVYPGAHVVSSDTWRGILYGDEGSQRQHPLTFSMVEREERIGLLEGQTVVSDQTSLTPFARKKELQLAQQMGVPVHLVMVATSLEEAQQGQHMRGLAGGRVVPDEVLQRMSNQLQKTLNVITSGKHGFHSATILNRAQAAAWDVQVPGIFPDDKRQQFRQRGLLAEWEQLGETMNAFVHELIEREYGEDRDSLDIPEIISEPLMLAYTTFYRALDNNIVQPRQLADSWQSFGEAHAAWIAWENSKIDEDAELDSEE